MFKFSIIIPTYNRIQNLSCCLMALAKQTYPTKYWEVIITDTGTDFTIQAIKKYTKIINISYLWRKEVTGNPGPAKNWAVQNSRSDTLIFIDSDVILNDRALEHYDRLHTKFPDVIICGRYDWLFPMNAREEDIASRFDKVISNQLPQIAPVSAGPLPGIDPRWQDNKVYEKSKPTRDFALGMFGGNTLIPKKWFVKSGGFDPNVRGHGGEDSELGWTMEEVGASAIFTDDTIGWHIWHPRNQEENEKAVRKNIIYIDKKHGIGKNGRRIVPLE